MTGSWRILPFAALLWVSAAGVVQAAQYRLAGDETQLAATLSQHEITRIALRDDRIVSVVARPQGWSIEHDGQTGDVFIVPHGAAGITEAVNLFITSEQGRVYQLFLSPADLPSEQIIIIGPRVADKELSSAPRRAALAELMRAILTGALTDAYERQLPQLSDLDYMPYGAVPGLSFEIVEAWQGDVFRGLDIQLTGGGADGLVESLVQSVAAAWVSGDKSRAIVIVERADDV